MKNKTILLILVITSLLLLSCDKKKENTYREKIGFDFKKINDSKNNQILKEKLLIDLYQKLLQNQNDSINRNFLFKISNIYYYDNEFDNYLKVVKKINKLAISDNDSVHIAKSLYYIGDYFDGKIMLDSAYSYYYKSEKIYSQIKDSINTSRLKINKAGILFDNGSFNECEIELIDALKLLTNRQKTEQLKFECYNILGLNLIELQNYTKSLEYFDLAMNQLNLTNNPNNNLSRSTGNNNIGNVYLKLKNYKKAKEYYQKGLATKNLKKGKPVLYAMLLNNLAYSKMMSGKLNGVKKMFFQSYKLRDSLQLDSGIISSKFFISQYYLHQKDTLKALENILQCYKLSKKVKSIPDVLNSLKILTEIDTPNKKYFANQYFTISDSLQQTERATRNKFARIEFETDKVEDENKLLSRKNTYILIGSIILLFLFVTIFIFYRLRTKNKELKLIQEQQQKSEEIYQLLLKQQSISQESRIEERNRIAMELHDNIVNSVFTTRFNLMQLESSQSAKKMELIKELEKTEAKIRHVSHELNENLNFKDNNIVLMLAKLIESQKNDWNTQFNFTIDKFIDWDKIDSDAKMNSYRIIQEAIHNVNKYSKAERCIVMILKTSSKTTIRIWDNGIGFNTRNIKKGIGLKNIKERAKSIKGEVKIISEINKGTTIEIIF